jgi:hypothetical protein
LGTEVMQTQNEVDEEDQEQIEVGEESEYHGLLNTFSESAGLPEDAEEAINVRTSFKNKRASQRVDSCWHFLKMTRLISLLQEFNFVVMSVMMATPWTGIRGSFKIPMRVAFDLYFRNPPVTPVAMIEGLYHHAYCNVCLLEYVEVIAIQDVPDASYHISILLVNFYHLSCRLSINIYEHRNLEWYSVSIL